ncbi:MAG: glycosyltransferase family 9 protein [Flavobacteriia bacterium]|nr:glycosyltransferase family 9 protein [Flavobacteriia bacterium]
MNYNEIHFDCLHFKGGVPCAPNKEKGSICKNCSDYYPIKTRILIIKLGALGDVIRTTPLLKKFRSLYPNVQFTWITQSPEILSKNEIHKILKWDGISIFSLQEVHFDIAINLDKEEEACQLLSRINAKQKYGFTWENNHISAVNQRAEHKLITGLFDEISKKNTKSYLEEIFEICDFSFNKEEYSIHINHFLSDKWKIEFQNFTNKKIIGLNTGCGPRWNTRLWPIEFWQELALLLDENGFFPVFLGGELEHEKNEELARVTNVYYPGYFSLEEFIALTNSCELIVTQVSMMMHIATALQKKLVLMNNIFNKYEFELYGRGVIVSPPLDCICYYGNTCKKGTSCMHDITPVSVFNAVKSLF